MIPISAVKDVSPSSIQLVGARDNATICGKDAWQPWIFPAGHGSLLALLKRLASLSTWDRMVMPGQAEAHTMHLCLEPHQTRVRLICLNVVLVYPRSGMFAAHADLPYSALRCVQVRRTLRPLHPVGILFRQPIRSTIR